MVKPQAEISSNVKTENRIQIRNYVKGPEEMSRHVI